MKHTVEQLESRQMFSASPTHAHAPTADALGPTPVPPVQRVTLGGLKFDGIFDADTGFQVLVPVRPRIERPVTPAQAMRTALREAKPVTRAEMVKSLTTGVIDLPDDPGSLQAVALAASTTAFNITLNLTGSGLTDGIRAAFTAAAAKWERIITADVPDVSGIDDVQIDGTISPIDGAGRILGQAGPTSLRSGSFIPVRGTMQFDSADLSSLLSSGSLGDVIFHEMGHVLGVGTIWSFKRLTTGASTDPRFTGVNAIAAYRALGGADATVPLENTGGSGTAGAHWRESIFANEIMTGFLNSGTNPASTITIASMTDLGYTVDLGAAETYRIPGVVPSGDVGSISGRVFTDRNRDGAFNNDDTPLASRTMFLDANGNARLDAGEKTAVSGTDGTYTFTNLTPGTFSVRAVVTGTVVLTTSTASVTVATSQSVTGVDVGTFDTAASVAGVVYNDVNNNGTRDQGEPALAGRLVFVDTNGNGRADVGERFATTKTDGSYAFTGLTAGTYSLRITVASGLNLTSGTSVTVDEGATLSDNNIGIFDSNASVSGTVFNDLNRNGTRDAGEPVFAARSVYIDANDNGTFDAGERLAVASAAGLFTITGLVPATYKLRVVTTTPFRQSTDAEVSLAAGESKTAINRGIFDTSGSIAGTLFNDLDQDGTRDDGEGVVGQRVVFVDANANSRLDTGEKFATAATNGTFRITGVVPGTHSIRTVLPGGQIQTTTLTVTVDTAQAVTGADLGNYDTTSTVSGFVYSDPNNNAVRENGETGRGQVTVYADANNNSRLDASERSALSATDGSFRLVGVLPGEYNLRTVLAANLRQSTTNALTLTGGQTIQNLQIGAFDTNATLGGTVFTDLNENGARDVGELPLRGITVFLDTNDNGTLDRTERSTVSGADGTFLFTALAAGAFNARVVLPTGMIQTLPVAFDPNLRTALAVALQAGEVNRGGLFGLLSTSGNVTGTIFFDNNRNARKDAGDVAGARQVVYLDRNNNSTLDTGEPLGVANTAGTYAFANVARGNYVIRLVTPSGLVQSLPTDNAGINITVRAGQTTTVDPFGIARSSTPPAALLPSPNAALFPSPSTFADARNNAARVADLFSDLPVAA